MLSSKAIIYSYGKSKFCLNQKKSMNVSVGVSVPEYGQNTNISTVSHVSATIPPPGARLIDWLFGPNSTCHVKKKVKAKELMHGIENENAYALKFGNGIEAYAKGKTMEQFTNFFQSERPFRINVCVIHPVNGSHVQVMSLKRPYKRLGGELKVKDASNGEVLGYVKKETCLTSRKLVVKDEEGNDCYYLKASAFFGKNFHIYDSREHQDKSTGFIKKEWCGILKEMYGESECFSITFPASATPKEKALLLSAIFLIDFIYFEDNEKLQF